SNCSGYDRASIVFDHATDTRYDATLSVPYCSGSNTPFSFTGQLYPGTYKVTVRKSSYDTNNLPSWDSVVVERLAIP
ncbi:MAG: hypothetical protein ACYC8T_29695, partial [Myxococcaceae bacterium]